MATIVGVPCLLAVLFPHRILCGSQCVGEEYGKNGGVEFHGDRCGGEGKLEFVDGKLRRLSIGYLTRLVLYLLVY